MAYGEKYFIPYCDPYGHVCRISILKNEYEGATTELIGQPDPFIKDYENKDEFKFQTIIPSKATIGIVFDAQSGLQFEEFWESDEKTFKVEHLIDDVLDWTGYVIPDGFSYDFIGGRYYATLTANDGLGTLEGHLFVDPNSGDIYGHTDLTYNDGFMFPFILIATEILRKLELDIDLWTLIDVYEQSMTDRTSDSRNSDPLAISYANTKTYINETDREDIPYFEDAGQAWNCKKVLENLLNIWSARLYQEKGVWRIKRITIDSKYGYVFPIQQGEDYWFKATFNEDGSDVFPTNQDLYSDADTLIVGSNVENVIGSGVAIDGYYKLNSIDAIVRVEDNEVTEVIAYTQPIFYWHKYNTLAVYIGREEIDDAVFIPCNNNEQFLLGNDHVMRMDEVYKQFRVNYKYAYIREGDSPINLIRNGNFSQFYTQYGGLEAPPEWERWRLNTKWYPRLRVVSLSPTDKQIVGANDALEMHLQYNDNNTAGTDPYPAKWAALTQLTDELDSKVKSMKLRVWVKLRYEKEFSGTNPFNLESSVYYPIFKAFFQEQPNAQSMLTGSELDTYHLVNTNDPRKLEWDKTKELPAFNGTFGLTLTSGKFFYLDPKLSLNYDPLDFSNKWYQFEYDVEAPPITGKLSFYIHGLGSNKGSTSGAFPPFVVKFPQGTTTVDKELPVITTWGDIPKPQFTNIFFGYIPDPNEEAPDEDYIYANANVNYTDQREPIEIFNGDTPNPEILSTIIVPTNTTGEKNKWDTSSNDFGKSDIGLIVAKAVMSQYNKPYRLLEGGISSDNIYFGSRFEFGALPNIQFILLRGSFNPKRGYLESCTFAQITSSAIAKGGLINGGTLDPIYSNTGNVRCVKDESGENTGFVQAQFLDVNPNSETYGQTRWDTQGYNVTACPLGEPSKYYWGTDDAGYDLENFTDFTIDFEDATSVQVSFDNVGGKYIFFLHLDSLGVVERVSNDFQYQIISSFQYLADITINGYLYRVLRQDFVTSEFVDFPLTFHFNDGTEEPVVIIHPVSLYYNVSTSAGACADTVTDDYYYIGTSFEASIGIYTDASATITAPAGWYRASVLVKYWNGAIFTMSTGCIP